MKLFSNLISKRPTETKRSLVAMDTEVDVPAADFQGLKNMVKIWPKIKYYTIKVKM